jgi:DNA-binding XRE family transcriptional regulator
MREAKQRRLAAKGWKTGDAKDFLGLSKQEEVYIDLRLKLAEGLKSRRIQRRFTQIELAKAVQSSQSRIAKMESGDPTVSLDLLIKSLLALGASARELARIIAGPASAPAHR